MRFAKILFVAAISLFIVNNLKAITIGDVEQVGHITVSGSEASQGDSLFIGKIKLSLTDDKSNDIVVLDVTRENKSSSFANIVKTNLETIAGTSVGQQLLIDITSCGDGDLIILNTNLCDVILGENADTILEEFAKDNSSNFDNALRKEIVAKTQETLGITNGCNISFKDFLYNIRNYPCFLNKNATQYKNNVIVIGDLSESIVTFSHESLNNVWVTLQKNNR